ncbi:ATP-dependent metallopeptidase FtsH/Yme1/Tma family protein [Candidatus Margulisiibacteriota bacterium]
MKNKQFDWRNLVLYGILALLLLSLFAPLMGEADRATEISFSEFLNYLDAGQIKEVTINGEIITGNLKTGKNFKSRSYNYPNLVSVLRDKNVAIKVENPAENAWIMGFLFQLMPVILFMAIFYWLILRQASSMNNQAMAFGKSKAKPLQGKTNITFANVAGVDEAKEELYEIVDFLKNPKKYQALGAKIPKGLILMGAPGTGKTLLARAIAGEAGVPFFSISGSDFVEMFVGVGASVTGDTPVLIREEEKTRLLPIGEFIDQYYKSDVEGYLPIEGVRTLGYEGKTTQRYSSEKKFFGQSNWKGVKGVYRHKVNEIYEIEFSDGAVKTTGDHSIFVREGNHIVSKEASELKVGEKLVNLPFKVRGKYSPELGTQHHVRAFNFPAQVDLELELWEELPTWFNKIVYSIVKKEAMLQSQIGAKVGVTGSAVGTWQREEKKPQYLSSVSKYPYLPKTVKVTSQLMKLLGYYTAEGRDNNGLEFIFGIHEGEVIRDCIELMKNTFNVEPRLETTNTNSVRIHYVAPLGDFFARHCGNGSHKKHVPEFIWDLPEEYFLSYLEGWSIGDGYITTNEKLSITSVSYQLILEMSWLCAMHGIKVGIRHGKNKPGRIIQKKPLPGGEYWSIVIGKTSNPFIQQSSPTKQIKKSVITKIVKKEFKGFVYDLCGCDNEAFFGGEKPILLHNSRVRGVFKEAKKQTPSIIFMDEIDAVGRHRGAGLGGGHDEREQTLNQLLVEMDGFDPNINIIVIAATNRPDILDPALLRPGRFDRQIVLDKPDLKGRKEILDIHAKNKPLEDAVELSILARRTPGFTGADLENVLNEAAILAARAEKKKISMKECEEAVDRVMAGPERKSRVVSDKEKKIIAHHEVGHALLSKILPGADSVHKISILPRGMALGYTLQLPLEDKYLISKKQIMDEITVLLGGRSAEEIFFSELTSGAHNDLERATQLAKRMVCEYGMSELGPRTFGRKDRQVFLGRDIAEMKDYSEDTADEIDKEIDKIIAACNKRAKKILSCNKAKAEEIAAVLMEKETLEGEALENVLKGIAAEEEC